VSDIETNLHDDDSSGRGEKNLILGQCATRTVLALIIYAAGQFNWWLGLTLLVIFSLIVLVNMLPTLVMLIAETSIGVVTYARIRRGINVQNLERLDNKAFEKNLVELGKMNLYLVGRDLFSLALVFGLSFFLYQKA